MAATLALLAHGEEVLAADAHDDARLRVVVEELGVEGALGAGPEILQVADRVVVSPGIRPSDAVLQEAAK